MWQIYDRVLASGRVETLVSLTLITAAVPGEGLCFSRIGTM
jgi:ABC-type protease/lipase transport system fused ATPase/permease subunit